MRSAYLILFALPLLAAAPTAEIKVDQAGYLPQAPKIAFVVAKSPAADFTVRAAANDAIMLRGKLSAPADDPDSGDRLQAADFSTFTRIGEYYLDIPGIGRSWPFSIGPQVYARPWYLAMRSFYGQRCGIAVDLGPSSPATSTPPATWTRLSTPPRAKRASPSRAAGTTPATMAATSSTPASRPPRFCGPGSSTVPA